MGCLEAPNDEVARPQFCHPLPSIRGEYTMALGRANQFRAIIQTNARRRLLSSIVMLKHTMAAHRDSSVGDLHERIWLLDVRERLDGQQAMRCWNQCSGGQALADRV